MERASTSKQPIVCALLVYYNQRSAVLAAFIHPFMIGRAELVNNYSISNIIYGVANHNSFDLSSVSAATGAHTEYSQIDPLSTVGCSTDFDVMIKYCIIYILSLLRGADLMILSTLSRSCGILAS